MCQIWLTILGKKKQYKAPTVKLYQRENMYKIVWSPDSETLLKGKYVKERQRRMECCTKGGRI